MGEHGVSCSMRSTWRAPNEVALDNPRTASRCVSVSFMCSSQLVATRHFYCIVCCQAALAPPRV